MSQNDICAVDPVKYPSKEDRMKTVRIATKCTVGSLVGIFMTAATKNVVATIGGNKLAKFGVRAGGFLIGLWIGGEVSDRFCNVIEETMNVLSDVKNAIENGGSN